MEYLTESCLGIHSTYKLEVLRGFDPQRVANLSLAEDSASTLRSALPPGLSEVSAVRLWTRLQFWPGKFWENCGEPTLCDPSSYTHGGFLGLVFAHTKPRTSPRPKHAQPTLSLS